MIFDTIDYRHGKVVIIDQTALPVEERVLELSTPDEVAAAIRALKVRGAPAIGIAAAYGILLSVENMAARALKPSGGYLFDHGKEGAPIDCTGLSAEEVIGAVERSAAVIESTRPTAADLFHAAARMKKAAYAERKDAGGIISALSREAFSIHDEELEIEKKIGKNGSGLLTDGMSVLTHCNAGGLATAGYGTALGVVYAAAEQGKRLKVYAGETRPLMQGARLTSWELSKNGIETVVLCDSAAASLMASGRIDIVITGADRVARNGDTANKIGTLGLAVLSGHYGIPFYVAAPRSTFDPSVETGDGITIEQRPSEEVKCFQGVRTVPWDVDVYNPAFDVTPASLITGFITEYGIIRKPFGDWIGSLQR